MQHADAHTQQVLLKHSRTNRDGNKRAVAIYKQKFHILQARTLWLHAKPPRAGLLAAPQAANAFSYLGAAPTETNSKNKP